MNRPAVRQTFPVAPGQPVLIHPAASAIADAALYQLDPQRWPNGAYQLVLTAADSGSGQVLASGAGTTYYVSNPAIGSISPDGLFQAAALGQTCVTVIHGPQSAEVPIRVVQPSVGPTAVGPDGAIVANADGIALGIGPDSLPERTLVQVDTLMTQDMPYELPYGFDPGGMFQVET